MNELVRPRWIRALAVAGLALLLCTESAQAGAFDRTAHWAGRFGEAAFDVIVLRPLSAVALAAGSVFFVASAPVSTPDGWIRTGSFVEGVRPAWSTFVYAPYEYTVLRGIGEF